MSKECDRMSNAEYWRERKRDWDIGSLSNIWQNETGTHLPGSSVFYGWSSASTGVKRDVEVDELGVLQLFLIIRIGAQDQDDGDGGKTAQLQMGADSDSAKHFTANTETE